jgi:UDP-glucose 4-epimerase
LQEFRERNISNFIFSSSCTVYGQADKMPIDEETELKLPESSYGKTKQMGEEILRDFAAAYKKRVIFIKIFQSNWCASFCKIRRITNRNS